MYKTFKAIVYYFSGNTYTVTIFARDNAEAEAILDSELLKAVHAKKIRGLDCIAGTSMQYAIAS